MGKGKSSRDCFRIVQEELVHRWCCCIAEYQYEKAIVVSRLRWDRGVYWCHEYLPYFLAECLTDWTYRFTGNIINIGLICIYYDLLNWRAGMVYQLNAETRRFRLSSQPGQAIKAITFFEKVVDRPTEFSVSVLLEE